MGVMWKVKVVSYHEAARFDQAGRWVSYSAQSWLLCGYVTIFNPLTHFVRKISERHGRYIYMYVLLPCHWSGIIENWIYNVIFSKELPI